MSGSPFYINSNLDLRIRCPICKAEYGLNSSEVLDRKEGVASIYLSCPKCLSSLLVTVTFGSSGGILVAAMLTDLKLEDIKKFKKVNPISVDDVIEIHKELEGLKSRKRQ